MEDRYPWLSVLGFLSKLAAVASLFAFLLRRGGLRPIAVAAVTAAQTMTLLCVVPAPAEFVFATTFVVGTCTYAVLVVDRPWIRIGIVTACFITYGALVAQVSRMLFLFSLTPLALWTSFMVMIRDWARTKPGSE